MIVTRIEPYNKTKSKIYIDYEFAFVLYKGEIHKMHIVQDMEMSDELYSEIMNNVLIKRGRIYAMNILQKQDKTEHDLRKKLKDAFYPEEIINDAIDYVKGFKYIDDVRYSVAYINMSLNRMSKAEIVNKLSQKGVSKYDIETAFSEFEEYENECIEDKEIELIIKLIHKKFPEEQPEYEDKMRLFASLYRKGFSTSRIEKAYARAFLT